MPTGRAVILSFLQCDSHLIFLTMCEYLVQNINLRLSFLTNSSVGGRPADLGITLQHSYSRYRTSQFSSGIRKFELRQEDRKNKWKTSVASSNLVPQISSLMHIYRPRVVSPGVSLSSTVRVQIQTVPIKDKRQRGRSGSTHGWHNQYRFVVCDLLYFCQTDNELQPI